MGSNPTSSVCRAGATPKRAPQPSIFHGAQAPRLAMLEMPMREWTLLCALCLLPACTGEVTAFAALVFSMTMGAWVVGRERQRRALLEAEALRRAIASGRHRRIEQRLRRELALAAAGEAVSAERLWLARAQLGGLLVAEWRLDEARAIYEGAEGQLSPHLRALAAYGRHELAVVAEAVDGGRLAAIQADRDRCLEFVPESYRATVRQAWEALEGLCLVRMGHAREAVTLLERGLESVAYNPARVVYLFHLAQAHEHLGERRLAASRYEAAMLAFPGTRLASEARSRLHALSGAEEHFFRGMLPEPPVQRPAALADAPMR